MKFRSTFVYFLVLLALGATYGVLRMEKQKAATKAKESRLVFTFSPKTVSQLDIRSGQDKTISLKKTDKWAISSPIVSQVDNMQLTGLLSTLHHVSMVRKIGKPTGDLKAFGLDKPSLVVRFLTGGKWLELEAGSKNPAQTGFYARAGKEGEVFLISSQAYDDLNKNLTDLRRKELFSWEPHQVKAFEIKWRNGDQLDLERQGDTSIWKSKRQPALKISTDKVDRLLQGLHWLRASNFLKNGAMPSAPDIDITFQLKDGKSRELKVALPQPGQKQAVTTSSELQCPVLLSTYFVSSIPHSADSLVDRSLCSRPSDIKKIAWKTSIGSGDVVLMNGGKWGKVVGTAAPKAMKNSWAVQSFLAFMHNAAYISGSAHPAGKPPQDAANSIQLVDRFGKMSSLAWNTPAPKDTGPVTAWLDKGGALQQVQLESKDIRTMTDSLAQLSGEQ
ncbi:MAG: DUF4340 domain-containing protein [Syntrophobacteraceae bacterium]